MTKKIMLALGAIFMAVPALAEEAAKAPLVTGEAAGLVAIAVGLCLGAAAFGGSLGQGKAAASALEGVARNPAASGKLLVPLILSLAFIESLTIYALVIAIKLLDKF